MHIDVVYQQDKVERQKLQGLLEPLFIPIHLQESASLYFNTDFITNLPKIEDLSSILMVVDKFSKYATCIPTSKYYMAKETTRLFFKFLVKYWGVPQHIINDRDAKFMGSFQMELLKFLSSQINIFSNYHLQIDGQTKRFNDMLEEYLRHFVSTNQKNQAQLLNVT